MSDLKADKYDRLVQEHFQDFCADLARECGVSPIASIVVVEWPDTNGSVAVQMLPNLDRPMMLKIVDGLSRKLGGAVTMLKSKINTVVATEKAKLQ